MRTPIIRFALAGSAAAVLGLLATPASAAGKPTWRIEATFRHCDGDDSLSALTADGRTDAWAVGEPNAGGPGCDADVEHWNGSAWRRIAVPPSDGLGFQFTPSIAASSASDAWIFPAQLTFTQKLNANFSTAAHWTGSAWRTYKFPRRINVDSALDFSPTNAWVFAGYFTSDSSTRPYVARFNGHAWRKAAVPDKALAVSATGPNDIWAVGPSLSTITKPPATQRIVAMHWTGLAWHDLTVPVPSTQKKQRPEYVLLAAGPRDLWLSYNTTRPTLLHWTGSRWRKIPVPHQVFGTDKLAADGRGGIWLLGDGNLDSASDSQFWAHYAGGRWRTEKVFSPKGYNLTLFDLAQIPGTTSELAVGEADKNTGNSAEGIVDRYK